MYGGWHDYVGTCVSAWAPEGMTARLRAPRGAWRVACSTRWQCSVRERARASAFERVS